VSQIHIGSDDGISARVIVLNSVVILLREACTPSD